LTALTEQYPTNPQEPQRQGKKILERWKTDPALRGVSQDSTIDDLPVLAAPETGLPSQSAIQTEIARRKGGK